MQKPMDKIKNYAQILSITDLKAEKESLDCRLFEELWCCDQTSCQDYSNIQLLSFKIRLL